MRFAITFGGRVNKQQFYDLCRQWILDPCFFYVQNGPLPGRKALCGQADVYVVGEQRDSENL